MLTMVTAVGDCGIDDDGCDENEDGKHHNQCA